MAMKIIFRSMIVLLVLALALPFVGTARAARLLTNDPSFAWNTFLGGPGSVSGGDVGLAAAADSAGNVYVTGSSGASWGSPVRAFTAGGRDAFVAKLDSAGNLVWNTFLGSSQTDAGYAVTVDSSGNVYVAGSSSDSTPWGSPVRTTGGGFTGDAFVAKLDSSGNLVWNTFLGSVQQVVNAANDIGRSIAIDSNGNLYVAGSSNAAWGCIPSCTQRAYTSGSGTSAFDGFVARLNGSTGVLVWNTFLGGAGLDTANAIDVDATGVYVVGDSGATWGSPVRPVTAPTDYFTDTFVAKLVAATGAVSLNTFLGGSGVDKGHGLALDASGNVFLAGDTNASWSCTPTPCTTRAQDGQDAYAARVDPLTLNLVWNAYLGGTGIDFGSAMALDALGNVFVTGDSDATWGSPARAFTVDAAGKTDVFVARLDANGTFTHNTFLGTTADDNGYGLGASFGGTAYAVGKTQATWGNPIRPFSSTLIPPQGAFVVAVDFTGPSVLSSVRASANPTNQATVNYTVAFSEPVTGVDATDFSLTLSGVTGASVTGVTGSGATRTVTVNTGNGDGTIRLNVLDNNSIVDQGANSLTAAFTSGEVYTVSKTLTFNSVAAQDGFILESTETSGVGGTVDATAVTFNLGDDAANKQFRAVLHFNTATLPDTAVITKATLKIKKNALVGTDPFTTHGALRADLAKPFFGTAMGLQAADFQATPGNASIATFGATPVSNVYSAILNATGKANINLTGTTQFRLRFVTDDNNDLSADFVKFFSGNHTTVANQPQLVVEIVVP